MKPFNLERAKAGAPVVMENGKPCRIICFDKLGAYPIIAIYEPFNGEELCATYNLSGQGRLDGIDLKMVSKTKIVNGIEIEEGEHYAGIILDEETGLPSYHLILLHGEAESLEWRQAMDWAKEQNGELPTCREQSLLSANLKKQFKREWYWSAKQYSSNSSWGQHFINGYQDYIRNASISRARAIRRVLIGEAK